MEKSTGSFNRQAFQKIKKNPLGILSFALIVLAAIVTIFAYGISTYKVLNANQQNLELAHKPMGYYQKILDVPLYNYTINYSFKDVLFEIQYYKDSIEY